MHATTQGIAIPYPDTAEASLFLRLGPSRVKLAAADQDTWIMGTYEDASDLLPLDVRTEGRSTFIGQRVDLTRGVGSVALPVLDLAVGRKRPFALTLEVGAADNSLDLGGLPLTAVTVRAGAGRYAIDFSAPVNAEMRSLEIAAGAGEVSARRLGNAGAPDVRISGGVGRCVVDFGGELRRPIRARVDAGLAGIEVIVPASAPARVRTKAVAATVDVFGPVTRDGDTYLTRSAAGAAPTMIDIEVTIAFGSMLLRAE